MKPPGIIMRPFRRERGSVLVVCMVLAALGTIGVAAWFSLLDARSHQVEASFKALERRVAARNSRALAHQAIYTSVLPANNGVANDIIYALPDGKGRATVRANATVALRNDTAGPHAQDGATPLRSASTTLLVDLFDGAGETRWGYRLRNQHPALGGDLLSLHSPAVPSDSSALVAGNLRVKGRAVFWDAIVRDVSSGIRADEYLLPNNIVGTTTFNNVSGSAVLPLNYPHYLRTAGVTASGPAYRGELELVDNTVNPQNAYATRIGSAVPTQLKGNQAKSESKGPPTKPSSTDDATLLAFIENNAPSVVADELSKYPSLSTGVLVAALNKANPAMTKNHFHQVFNSQIDIPDDALTGMMATIIDADLDSALDVAITDLNVKNDAQFNGNGQGMVQIFIDRPENNQIIVEGVNRLRLFGQPNATKADAAALLPPLLVVVDNRASGSLTQIDLHHENKRPLIVVLAAPPGAPALPSVKFKGSSAFPTWRAIMDLQNVGLAFDLSGVAGARIVGGIRANHRIAVSGGTLTLEGDTEGNVLAPLLSRDAWIETIRN